MNAAPPTNINRKVIIMISWLIDPFTFAFMQRGLIAALIVGIICSLIGCFVVIRSMAFLGDAMAHAILPGIAIAYILGSSLISGALIAAVIIALGIGFLSKQAKIKEDTAIGILFTAALAVGIAIMSTIRTFAIDLTHILFGNILGVGSKDVIFVAVLGTAILVLLIIFFKEFMIISFDPVFAFTQKIRVNFFNNFLLILLSLTIVISIQTVGVVLVTAMLVTPGAAAYLIAKKLKYMMFISAGFGILSSIAGLYLSYYVNISSGSAIVLCATFIFLVVFLSSSGRKLFIRKIKSFTRNRQT
jgi:ABC-type Mn2+/Zn2+ transport system permease subunit